MKCIPANLRTAIISGVILLFIQACRKTEPVITPACFPGPACSAQTLLITTIAPTYPIGLGTYPAPYKFHKTFGSDGRVNYIDAFMGPNWSPSRFTGSVHYAGKRMCILKPGNDTIMVAELNDCGQVVKAKMNNVYPWSPDPDYYTQRYEYQYDSKGRISKMLTFYAPVYPPGIAVYQYDQYNNITRIQNETDPSRYIIYTYDYSRPIKGGFYDQGIVEGMGSYLMEMLGHINTQPHHVLLKIETTYEYPVGSSTFFDQVVGADGYLKAYNVNPFGNKFFGIRGEMVWKCASGSDVTYQK
jgi:hypothetical protein